MADLLELTHQHVLPVELHKLLVVLNVVLVETTPVHLVLVEMVNHGQELPVVVIMAAEAATEMPEAVDRDIYLII